MTTGMIFLITSPGFITPIEAIPTPDLAVPYAAPISDMTGNDGGIKSSRGGKNNSSTKKRMNFENQKNLLAKHNAAVTPMKPKNGADVGQVS